MSQVRTGMLIFTISTFRKQVVGSGSGLNSSWKYHHAEADTELFDSASSSTVLKKQASTRELDYVNDILCNVELMYMDFSLGRARDIVNPHLFNQLESRRGRRFESDGGECRMRRKIIFDCVSECLDLRCRRYVGGGYKMWAKGVAMVRKNGLGGGMSHRRCLGLSITTTSYDTSLTSISNSNILRSSFHIRNFKILE